MYLQGITFDSRFSTQKGMNNFESLLKRVSKENLFANKENS